MTINNNLGYLIALILTSLVSCQTSKTFVLEDSVMKTKAERIRKGNYELVSALDQLINQADSVMNTPVRSVMEKSATPPSGDKHDYLSQGTYWWPDPSKPDGLPYIRKDGKINPETGKIRDFHYMNELNNAVKILGVAYYYTRNESYVYDAIKRLRVWFIDTATRMNPNLNHSQAIPGVSDGREQGLIDTRSFVDLIDGIQLMASSKSFKQSDLDAIKEWFRDFLEWMTTSEMGIAAGKLENNIGTSYYMQAISYALFTGQKSKARKMLDMAVPELLETQFEHDGRQPRELSRTNAWSYSTSNLRYWFRIARLAEHLGRDLWNYKTLSGKGIRKGYEWLLPYANDEQEWTYDQIKQSNFRQTFAALRNAGTRKFSRSTYQGKRTVNDTTDLNQRFNRHVSEGVNNLKLDPLIILTDAI